MLRHSCKLFPSQYRLILLRLWPPCFDRFLQMRWCSDGFSADVGRQACVSCSGHFLSVFVNQIVLECKKCHVTEVLISNCCRHALLKMTTIHIITRFNHELNELIYVNVSQFTWVAECTRVYYASKQWGAERQPTRRSWKGGVSCVIQLSTRRAGNNS